MMHAELLQPMKGNPARERAAREAERAAHEHRRNRTRTEAEAIREGEEVVETMQRMLKQPEPARAHAATTPPIPQPTRAVSLYAEMVLRGMVKVIAPQSPWHLPRGAGERHTPTGAGPSQPGKVVKTFHAADFVNRER